MKTCPKCGASIIDEAVFCTSCGYHFEDAAPAASNTTEQPAQEAAPAAETAPSQGTIPAPEAAPAQNFQQPAFQQAPINNQYPYGQITPQQPVAAAPSFKPENPLDKLLGLVAYFSLFGILIAYFGGDVNGQRSAYLKFHCNQALTLFLFGLISIIPIIGWLWGIFIFVCTVIAFVGACKGETKSVLFFGTIKIIQ